MNETADILIKGKVYKVKNVNNVNVSIFEFDNKTQDIVELSVGHTLWEACYHWFVESAHRANIENLVNTMVLKMGYNLSEDLITSQYQIDNFLENLTGEEFFKILTLHKEQYYVKWKEQGNDTFS